METKFSAIIARATTFLNVIVDKTLRVVNPSLQRSTTRRLHVESLEDRCLLSVTPFSSTDLPHLVDGDDLYQRMMQSEPVIDEAVLIGLDNFQLNRPAAQPPDMAVLPPPRPHGQIRPLRFVDADFLDLLETDDDSLMMSLSESGDDGSGGGDVPTISIELTGNSEIYEHSSQTITIRVNASDPDGESTRTILKFRVLMKTDADTDWEDAEYGVDYYFDLPYIHSPQQHSNHDYGLFSGCCVWPDDDGYFYIADLSGGAYSDIPLVPINDAKPESDKKLKIIPVLNPQYDESGGVMFCGYEVDGSSVEITIKDDDDWTVSASVLDAVALEPCTWIPGNERTGAFDITKSGGLDRSYGITVQFEMGGTAVPRGVGESADYHLTTNPNGGVAGDMIPISLQNGKWVGSITLGANQDSVILYVMPDGDYVFEEDETVTLTITDAYAVFGYSFNYSSAEDNVVIWQAPEFNSDTDVGVANGTRPTAVNGDSYQGYISRNAEAGDVVYTAKSTQAHENQGATHYFVVGNQTGQMLYLNSNGTFSLESTLDNVSLFTIDGSSGRIRAATNFADLVLPLSLSFTIRAVSDACSAQYDEAGVTVGWAIVDLDTDSDNNGYINYRDDAANGYRRRAEDDMEESTAKPITYIPEGLSPPNDYIYVPMRVAFEVVDPTGLKFSFHHTTNLEIYDAGYNLVECYNADRTQVNLFWLNNLGGVYYVKAVGAGATGFGSGFDKVHIVLWDTDGNEMVRDTVAFIVKSTEMVDNGNWIIPCGWRIGDDGSLTTMTPESGAVGPQSEGNGIVSNKGYTYSKDTFADGFIMEFEYSFGEDGYLQPDTNGNEITPDGDLKKVSFVGNSGIKIGGASSFEIAIIDISSMVALVGGVEAFIARIDNNTGMVALSDLGYENEPISKLMNGIGYGAIGGIVDSHGKTYQELFEENYALFGDQNGGKMIVELECATVSVFVWNSTIKEYKKYYEGISVPIGDGHVYIQSHWGSGVTYNNMTLELL